MKQKIELKQLNLNSITIKNKPKVEYFDNKEDNCTYAIVRIKSEGLYKLHYYLKENFDNKDSFPHFKPHISIACLKFGERILNAKIDEFIWKAKEMIFRNKDISLEKIKLEAKMKNIEKIAKDIQTLRGIQLLWDKYKSNIKEFAKKIGDLIKRNRLSLTQDKSWLLKELKKLTGESWQLVGSDFKMASKRR